ncbi:MAG TPA: hypothetical protein VFG04_17295 [Planctomycetaceae bacterium]|nr:hypothetical protein [Planctomycetaceae bacterium]
MALSLSFGLLFGAVGCQNSDLQEFADRHVQQDMLDKHDKREAIPFLEERGRFYDIDETTHVDREIVLPLLKRLKELAPTEQWAMLEPEKAKSCYGVLIGLPDDSGIIDQMADAVQSADDKFSGFILQQWGHRWLLINLIDERTFESLKASNPDIEHQR